MIRLYTRNLGTIDIGGLTLPNISLSTDLTVRIGADIFLNSNLDTAMDPSDLVVDTAETILEELGHAYNYAQGSGGSSMIYDALLAPAVTIGNRKVSANEYNFETIMKNCNQ